MSRRCVVFGARFGYDARSLTCRRVGGKRESTCHTWSPSLIWSRLRRRPAISANRLRARASKKPSTSRLPGCLRGLRFAAPCFFGHCKAWEGLAESAKHNSCHMDKPLILSLDSHGVPHRWISWQQACFYYAKNLVAWTLGDETFTYYGGISRPTAAGVRPGAALCALRSEQGRVPDPHQPPHSRRPDGVPEAAPGVAFAVGPRACLISGAIAAFTCWNGTSRGACGSPTISCAPITCGRRSIRSRNRAMRSFDCMPLSWNIL